MTETKKETLPNLRFPEFSGEWETHPLSDAWQVKGKRNSKGKYSKEQVLSVSGDYGIVNQIDLLGRSYAGASVANYHVVETGDIVYTKSPLKTNPYGIIKANLGPPGIVSTLYAVYEVKEGHNPEFWNSYFCLNDRTNRYLLPLVHKGAKNDMKINNKRVLIDPVSSPQLAEQRKIAAFIASVDTKLTQLSDQQSLLENYKKGCIQKLFSGELRFLDQNGKAFPDWKFMRLWEITNFSKGKGISKADIVENGATPCIRYGEIYTIYREHITNVQSSTNDDPSTLFLSQAGDVIIPASGEDPLDMARACCVESDGIALGGDINVLRGAPNGVFLAYYLNNAKRKEIASYAQGNSVVHLYASQMRNLSIQLPHPDEQQKIAAFLSALDTKIDLVGQELAALQAFKKGLLQQMFV